MTRDIDKHNVFKGIIILFVVSIHILYKFHGHDKPRVLEIINYMIGFSVPLFMILGGFFLVSKLEYINNIEDIKYILLKLIKRIFFPYYIFIIILACFQILRNDRLYLSPFLLFDANTHGLYFIIVYIYSYVVSVVLAYLLVIVIKKRNIVLAFILPAISLLIFPITNIVIARLPNNNVAKALPYISYFIFGFPISFFCRRLSSLNSEQKNMWLLIIFLFCCFFSIGLYFARILFGHFPIISNNPPTFFFLIYSILVFVIIYILLDNYNIVTVIGKKLLLDKFGNQSLIIFYIHPYLIYLLPFAFGLFFKKIIHTNMFIFPWFVAAYLVTFISLKIYNIFPLKIKKIFSR